MGQLFPIEDYRTFGWYSNTHHKTIVVCDNSIAEMSGIKDVMVSLNMMFAQSIMNPFQTTGATLVSERLEKVVHQIVVKNNASVTRKK